MNCLSELKYIRCTCVIAERTTGVSVYPSVSSLVFETTHSANRKLFLRSCKPNLKAPIGELKKTERERERRKGREEERSEVKRKGKEIWRSRWKVKWPRLNCCKGKKLKSFSRVAIPNWKQKKYPIFFGLNFFWSIFFAAYMKNYKSIKKNFLAIKKTFYYFRSRRKKQDQKKNQIRRSKEKKTRKFTLSVNFYSLLSFWEIRVKVKKKNRQFIITYNFFFCSNISNVSSLCKRPKILSPF